MEDYASRVLGVIPFGPEPPPDPNSLSSPARPRREPRSNQQSADLLIGRLLVLRREAEGAGIDVSVIDECTTLFERVSTAPEPAPLTPQPNEIELTVKGQPVVLPLAQIIKFATRYAETVV